MFFFILKKNQKSRRFGCLRGMDSTKGEFVHTLNIRMRHWWLRGEGALRK